MAVDNTTCFWLDRILLMCLIYCAVDGDQKHLFNSIVALVLHDFIVFTVERPLQDVCAFISTLFNNSKNQKSGMIKPEYYNSMSEKGEVESSTRVEKNKEEQVTCGNCKEEAIKNKGKYKEKYKEKYKRKLSQKEERLEKVKSSLKDKYNEERDKWEEERKVLKKKCEELRWT